MGEMDIVNNLRLRKIDELLCSPQANRSEEETKISGNASFLVFQRFGKVSAEFGFAVE